MKRIVIIALITIMLLPLGCEDTLSYDSGNDGGSKEGYINVSIGDDTYTWLEYTGYITETNTLVLALFNGGRPYNYFVPIVDGVAKIANPTGGYVLFTNIQISPNGDMTAYIKTIDFED